MEQARDTVALSSRQEIVEVLSTKQTHCSFLSSRVQHIARLFSKSYIETIAAWVEQLSSVERGSFARMLQSLLVFDSSSSGGTSLRFGTPSSPAAAPSRAVSASPITHMADTSSYLATFKTPSPQPPRWRYDDVTAMRLSPVVQRSTTYALLELVEFT